MMLCTLTAGFTRDRHLSSPPDVRILAVTFADRSITPMVWHLDVQGVTGASHMYGQEEHCTLHSTV